MKKYLFIIYLILCIIVIIIIKFGKSFYYIQYYTTNLLDLEWSSSELNFSKRYNKQNALILLKYCVLSSAIYSESYYYNNHADFEYFYILRGKSFSRNDKIFGFIGIKNNYLIISIKSTSDLDDILVSSHNKLKDIDDGEIHKGFYIQSLELMYEIYNIMYKHKHINKIFITGHSLGGTMASIIGYIICNEIRKKDIIVYSFGSVKFGDNNLKNTIERKKNIKIFNINNNADLITHKPLNYKYKRIGEIIEHRIDTGNNIVNHGIRVYRECVLEVKNTMIKRRPYMFNEKVFSLFLDFIG